MADETERVVRCKPYHQNKGMEDEGSQRGKIMDTKSRCPAWMASDELRVKLLAEAIEDPEGGKDIRGRPKRLWNAISN